MNAPLFTDKVTQIFVAVDDFCLLFEKPIQQLLLQDTNGPKKRNRKDIEETNPKLIAAFYQQQQLLLVA